MVGMGVYKPGGRETGGEGTVKEIREPRDLEFMEGDDFSYPLSSPFSRGCPSMPSPVPNCRFPHVRLGSVTDMSAFGQKRT